MVALEAIFTAEEENETELPVPELEPFRSTVGAVFDLMGRANLALVGIGAIDPLASVFRHGVIPAAEIEAIAKAGAVGTICGWFYGARGELVSTEFDDRTLSVPPRVLQRVPLRIGVVMHAAKAAAVKAALVGGWINAVALDSQTAEELLRLR